MIQDGTIEEIQELKLAGCTYTTARAYDALRARHGKVPSLKTYASTTTWTTHPGATTRR